MEHDFWHARWNANEIGFHQDRPNPMLERHAETLGTPHGRRVLVPLCGKALDMAWLAARGWTVLGVELSRVAVEDFFAEQGIAAARSTDGAFEVLEGGGVRLLCGDVFALDTERMRGVSAAYDRAALVALPEPMRRDYAEGLMALLPPDAPVLLVTFEYPQEQAHGPPFSVGEDMVRRLFEAHRTVRHLGSAEVLEQFPHLQARGLEFLTEHAFALEPR